MQKKANGNVPLAKVMMEIVRKWQIVFGGVTSRGLTNNRLCAKKLQSIRSV